MNQPLNQRPGPKLYGEYLNDLGALPRGVGFSSYALGLAFSLVLTLGAYELATRHALGGWLMPGLAALAVAQFCVQALYFLHVGPHLSRARATVFFVALVVVVICVAGSVIIMNNLNSRMMPDAAHMMQYTQSQDAF